MTEQIFESHPIFSVQILHRRGSKGELIRYPSGEEVIYQRMDDTFPQAKRAAVAQQIYESLERPVFSQQSTQMPYTAEVLEKLMAIKGGITLLAWKKEKASQQLVGYIIGAPYKNYPPDLQITSQDVTTTDGQRLPLPDNLTWVADTTAVAASQQGQAIGATLFDLMMEECVKFSDSTKLATFLVQHETSKSPRMFDSHPILAEAREKGSLISGIVPYRGITAEYRLYNLK